MAVRIVTDSTFDIPAELAKEHNIKVVPLKVIFGDKEYVSDVDISKEEFYTKLTQSDELPTTAQVNPAEFTEAFEEILADGDEIVGVFIGAKLSGTYQSAFIALNHLDSNDISIIDTETVSIPALQLVLIAAEMATAGKTRTKIVSTLEALKRHSKLYFIIDTLKYLKKGGRIKPSAAAIGEVLKVKPILTINDGLVDTISKARGMNKAFAEIGHLISHTGQTLNDKRVIVGHTNTPENLEKLTEWIYKHYSPKELVICEIGSVVGTHAGPGAVAVSFLED
jgi:DegV family protein with EDD domain